MQFLVVYVLFIRVYVYCTIQYNYPRYIIKLLRDQPYTARTSVVVRAYWYNRKERNGNIHVTSGHTRTDQISEIPPLRRATFVLCTRMYIV